MKAEEIILWVLFLLGIAVVFWLIFGNTPTIEQALLILILTLVVKNSIDVKGLKSDLKHSKERFNALAKDFKEQARHRQK